MENVEICDIDLCSDLLEELIENWKCECLENLVYDLFLIGRV